MGCMLRPGVQSWPSGVLPYTIATEGFTDAALANIDKAIAHWNEVTSWRIVRRTSQRDYVTFRLRPSSSSPVGRQGGRQFISLANNAGFGGAAHEIGHAIGLHHEQNRADRNDRVVVMTDRIKGDAVYNFRQETDDHSCDHGPYDFGSIMHYSSKAFLGTKHYELGEGWTHVKPFDVDGTSSLLLLSESTGAMRIHRLDRDVGVGHEVERADLLSGWTTAEFFQRGGHTYLFLLKESTGRVHIHRMNADGTLGSRVDTRDWTGGWTTVEFWREGDEVFVFLLKERSGRVKVHRMNANGRFGRELDVQTWASGFTSAGIFEVGDQRYVAVLKRSSGLVDIRPIAADGTIGDVVHRADWTSGWTDITFFRRGNRTFLLRLKASTGDAHVFAMTSGGGIGAQVDGHDWSEGYTAVETYTIGTRAFLLLAKRSTGAALIRSIRMTGKIGSALRLSPPITIFAPEPIGQRRGLSPGDIAAANARIG